ncbi:MAG: hypothetical protein MJZ88_04590 [Paludibacteraceae bacterium]|nr:hypothetical protein [Paludibacteraceae bacterium]
MQKFKNCCGIVFGLLGVVLGTNSCAYYRNTTEVMYQSVHSVHKQPTEKEPIPETANIVVAYYLQTNGKLSVGVANQTDSIMIIDKTKSYFINNGQSVSYYDPTVKTTSTTDLSSSTRGASVNLGGIARAVGLGGAVGTALSAINVGGSGTSGSSTTNTTYSVEQTQLTIAPRGSAALPHVYKMNGVGSVSGTQTGLTKKTSPKKYAVCISYSIDGGKTFQLMKSEFYVSAEYIGKVASRETVNDAIRNLLIAKPDATAENWWWFTSPDLHTGSLYLYDYQ